jgi:hypothetical protein
MDDRGTVVEGNFAKRTSPDDPDEYQPFSFGRVGVKPQLTLLMRKATGEVEGFPYADFSGVSATDENTGFTVRFATRTVRVEGRNLRQLFQYVCSYKAAEIVETTMRSTMQIPEGKAVIWQIHIK